VGIGPGGPIGWVLSVRVDQAEGDDEFARGAYGWYWTMGVWTAYGRALREPIGVLH
jgi:hypothetical protein